MNITGNEVILADGQALTSWGIKHFLNKDYTFKITEVTESNALYTTVTNNIVLVVIDYLTVKDFDSGSITKFCNTFPDIPVLIITADQNKDAILKVLESGVSGFIFKDCLEDEIARSIKALLSGEKFFCNKVFDILMETRLTKAQVDSLPIELTTREIEIIKLVVTGNSTILIADKLNLSPHTVSTHRKNILKKLKIKSPVELVTYAYDLGLIKGR